MLRRNGPKEQPLSKRTANRKRLKWPSPTYLRLLHHAMNSHLDSEFENDHRRGSDRDLEYLLHLRMKQYSYSSCYPRIATTLLFVFSQQAGLAKELVLFAGPHKAAASSVQKFFHDHASGYNGSSTSTGLDGWIWPPVEDHLGDLEPHKVFNYLVTESDNYAVQSVLRRDILKAWDASTHGVILGTEEFDRIGENPETHYDALPVMQRVVSDLGVAAEDVTVVLNYRTPRIEQWISIWKHATHSSEAHYHKYLCGGDYSDRRWELLDTAMNPLKLASIYRQQGWKVALIDMGGAMEVGLDVAHVLSCEVLHNVDCRNGWVSDKVGESYHENALEKDLNSLQDAEKDELEHLLRERDCYYESVLKDDDGFTILYKDTIWQGCSAEHNATYEQMTDTTILYDAIRAQKGCSSDNVNVGDYLVGDVGSLTTHNHSQTVIEAVEDETRGGVEEPLMMSSRSRPGSSSESPVVTGLFLIIVVGVAGYQLYLMYPTAPDNRRNSIPDGGISLGMPDFVDEELDYEYGETQY